MLETIVEGLCGLVGLDKMAYRVRSYRRRGMLIGENVRLFSRLDSSEPYLVEIGDGTTISGDVHFITHDNAITKTSSDKNNIFGRVKIGKNCFIGWGAILLPGVELNDSVIVGAGSVVTKSFHEQGIVVAGNPAKRICTLEQYKDKYEDVAVRVTGAMSQDEIKVYITGDRGTRLVRK